MSDETELKPNRAVYTSPTQIWMLAHYYTNRAIDPLYSDACLAELGALNSLCDKGLLSRAVGGRRKYELTDKGRDFFERILALNPEGN